MLPLPLTKPRNLQNLSLEDRLQLTRPELNGFHCAIRRALLTGRMFGLLPLMGLSTNRSKHLRFTLLSPYALLFIASVAGQSVMFIMSLYWLLQNKFSLTNFTNFLFYTLSLVSLIMLANIGRSWPKLMEKVEEIERSLPPIKKNIPFYCNVTLISILLSALVEHILSILYGYAVAEFCDSNNIVETFFHYDKPWIFKYTPYSIWKGVIVEILNIQATFIWSYNDILIMVISIYLAEHFVIHNKFLKKAAREECFSCDEFRTQYLQIVRLVRLINNQVSIYIITCFGSNLYWICMQLFYSLNKNQTGHFISCSPSDMDAHEEKVHGIEHTIYFTYSVIFLVARTFLVLMLAARVHSKSIVPLSLLYELPTKKFNVEIERYIAQINNIKVALTGLDFFYVTRTMILTLIRTIVTYEFQPAVQQLDLAAGIFVDECLVTPVIDIKNKIPYHVQKSEEPPVIKQAKPRAKASSK